ncbi:RCC1 domain-containing protein 1 [Nasonia vitripennis]|uniref:Uncharacterized protein n=1 Tax=Nasonia vitripennis TaxID=7425 RepID=A0A7M7GE16_NASVI|nr:RCC1 domain-containing protein 1 [Nasonia vitripennis]XP_031787100.1 RCC1 domain-containing protein 1 [Nasonia vitripennis]
MAKIYYTGLSTSKFICDDESDDSTNLVVNDQFIPVPWEDVTDIEIGWDYFLIWKNNKVHIVGKIVGEKCEKVIQSLRIPDCANTNFKQAIAGSENVTVLTDDQDIWIHNMYNGNWKKVPNFISTADEDKKECVVKIAQGRCTVALTNLGQVFNIPISLNDPESLIFIDVACGYDHTLLLAKDGGVYSVGMGTRGQLGHGDLEDCDEPKLIEALAGLKIVQISSGGWHSAVVTDQGDLYTWGWNNQGQLGHPDVENVVAVPKIVDFIDETEETVEINIKKAQCGSAFTICMTDSDKLWGCGSNKYGQLGLPREAFTSVKKFVAIKLPNIEKPIRDFKCREWGSCIYT